MSRRHLPGDDAPHQDDDDFASVSHDNESDNEDSYVVDRPAGWWNRDMGATPVIAVGLAIVTVLVVIGLVFVLMPREPVPPQQDVVIQAPSQVEVPFLGPAAPGAALVLEPGMECAISNLRKSHVPISGFGGQAALMFEYQFPRGKERVVPRLLVAVVTEPGGKPASATLSPLDDSGTVSIAPIGGAGAFPRGTTLYLGDQLDEGPRGLPKRVSNILTLE